MPMHWTAVTPASKANIFALEQRTNDGKFSFR